MTCKHVRQPLVATRRGPSSSAWSPLAATLMAPLLHPVWTSEMPIYDTMCRSVP